MQASAEGVGAVGVRIESGAGEERVEERFFLLAQLVFRIAREVIRFRGRREVDERRDSAGRAGEYDVAVFVGPREFEMHCPARGRNNEVETRAGILPAPPPGCDGAGRSNPYTSKYFACGWWAMIASVDCSGTSMKFSFSVTPISSGRKSCAMSARSSRFGHAG